MVTGAPAEPAYPNGRCPVDGAIAPRCQLRALCTAGGATTLANWVLVTPRRRPWCQCLLLTVRW